MKNNGTKLLLLVAVIALWAYIAYLVFGYVNPSEPVSDVVPKKTVKEAADVSHTELSLNYDDPFLKNQRKERPKATYTGPRASPKPVQPSATSSKVKWPSVTYMGFVKGSSTQIMLNYNGKTKLVGLGQALDSFQISAINSDKLTLSCNGEQRNYSK